MKFKFDKKLLFKIHGWVGIKLSIVFFVVCFSGTLAVFSHEMDWLFIPEMRAEPSETLASYNLAVSNIKSEFPNGKILYWSRSRENYLTDIVMLSLGKKKIKYVFINPYTAELQGSADYTFQRFFRDLHYTLFIPMHIGQYIVLFFGFVLLASLVTSLYINKYWYKNLFNLKLGKGQRVFYSSLHKLVGAWSIPFMALITITSIWYFVERTDFPKVSTYLKTSTPKVDTTNIKIDMKNLSYQIDYDKCIELAENAIEGLKVKTISPPRKPDSPLNLTGLSHVPLVRNRSNRINLDPHRNEILMIQRAENINTLTWINDIADPLHFGYWGGWITKIFYFIFGLALSSLILTGPWLYIKRRLNIKKLKKSGIKNNG